MLNSFQNFHTNGFPIEILSVISVFALLFAVLVINSKNPVVSVLFLIGLFLSIASYLFSLGMHFLGMAYLLVYVGAVSILFLFILMLINVRISELSSNTNNTLSLGFIISIFLSAVLYEILPNSTISFNNMSQLVESININVIYYVTSVSWDKNLAEVSHITSIGNVLYTVYSILIILTAIILLLAMVGAIAITIKQKSNDTVNNYNLTSSLGGNSIISLIAIKCVIILISFFDVSMLSIENILSIGEMNIVSLDFFSVGSSVNLPGTGEIIVTIEIEVTEEDNDGSPLGTVTTITAGNGSGNINGDLDLDVDINETESNQN